MWRPNFKAYVTHNWSRPIGVDYSKRNLVEIGTDTRRINLSSKRDGWKLVYVAEKGLLPMALKPQK